MRFRKWSQIIALILLLPSLGIVLFYLFVPMVVEKIASQRLGQIPGLEGITFKVRSMGFSGADIQEVTTGKSLSIDSVHLDYSILSLVQKRVNQVIVSGLDLRGKITPSGLEFADFPLERKVTLPTPVASGPVNPGPVAYELGAFSALLPQKIRITNSIVTIAMDNHDIRLPFEILSSMEERNMEDKKKPIHILIRLFPHGEMVEGAVTLNSMAEIETAELKARGVELSHLNPLISLFAPVVLDGKVDFLISKTAQSNWIITLSRMGVNKPLDLKVSDLVCNVITLSPFAVEGSLLLENSMVRPVFVNFSGALGPDKEWNLGIKAGYNGLKDYKLLLGEKELLLMNPGVDIRASGTGVVGKIELLAKADKCSGKLQDLSGSISSMSLTGKGNFDLKEDESPFDMNFIAKSGPVKIESKEFYCKASSFAIPGKLALNGKFAPRVAFTPTVTGGEAGASLLKVFAKDISLTVPVSFPFVKAKDRGRYSVAEFIQDKKKIANLTGTMDQTNDGFIASGRVDLSSILGKTGKPGFDVSLRTWLSPLKVEADMNMGQQNILSKNIPGNFLPKKSDLEFSIMVDASGKLLFEKNRATCKFDINLAQGELSSKEKKLYIKGVKGALGFDDLFSLRSRPGQKLTIDSIRINEISVSNLTLDYTIESMDSLLVEHAGFKWCDGGVSTESMRISSRKDDYRLNLFCDRLKLSEILRQVGSFQAEGDGTLNGQIPLVYSGGEISFNNGFLYSTPGRGGKIRVRGTESLTASIPRDSFQYAQIDLAREALKDYQYNWARLAFNTKGETLFVKMEFDGEPGNVLPFVYKEEIGGFARVDALGKGSKFQGIKIDVNLELPFNRVVKFGSNLNKMMR